MPDSQVSVQAQRRAFRPKLWAFVLTLVFVALTVRLGLWQGDRAQYKIDQQSQLDKALAAAPLRSSDLDFATDFKAELRYRSVTLTGIFVANELFFVDNRIVDGKAGYGLLQGFRAETAHGAAQPLLIDRGWVKSTGDRSTLPKIDSPTGRITLVGRINVPPSRNPGTFDNDGGQRLNYVNIAELAKKLNLRFAPFLIEQIEGPGFSGIVRSLPGANFEKNRGYQLQWFGFAALAVVLFLVLSFRKE